MNTKLPACRDGADPCEKTISEGFFEQWLHAEVHGTQPHGIILVIVNFDTGRLVSQLENEGLV